MKKVIRLTERDLTKLIKRIVKEQNASDEVVVGTVLNTAIGERTVKEVEFGRGEQMLRSVTLHLDNGGMLEFKCTAHEKGTYMLYPTGGGENTLTQGQSQYLYNKYCKK